MPPAVAVPNVRSIAYRIDRYQRCLPEGSPINRIWSAHAYVEKVLLLSRNCVSNAAAIVSVFARNFKAGLAHPTIRFLGYVRIL